MADCSPALSGGESCHLLAVTVFGTGLFALFEEHPWFGGFYTAVGAGGILLVSRHLMGKPLGALSSGPVTSLALLVALTLTWIFLGYDIWYVPHAPPPAKGFEPIPENSSRLDIVRYSVPPPESGKEYYINWYVSNNGKIATLGDTHLALSLMGPKEIPDFLIDGDFAKLSFELAQAKLTDQQRYSNQSPWYTSTYFSKSVTDKDISDITGGSLYAYALILWKYKDKDTPSDKFYYTEACVYVYQSVVHFCNSHNKSYMAN